MIDVCLTKSIREKQIEAAYLTRVLELWAAAEAQGIDSSEGGSFGLDTRLLTLKQRQEYHRHPGRFIHRCHSRSNRPKLYNYFRYPDDRIVTLYPLLEAVYCESLT